MRHGFGAALTLLTGGSGGQVIESVTGLLDLNYSREEEMVVDRFAIQSLDAVYGDRQGRRACLKSWKRMECCRNGPICF